MEKQPPATGATTISSSRAIAATMFMAVVASSFLLFLPVLIGGLSGFGLTSSQISVIAAADLGGISLCSLAAAYWINRVSWQHAALVGLLLIIAGNVACYWVQDFSGLAMLRFAVGIGEGVLMPINLACLARTKVPDRNFGIFIVLQTIHAMIGLALIPYLVAFSGVGATFILMAGLALVVLPMLRWLPDSLANSKNDTDIEQTTTALRLNGKALLTLGAIFFFFAVQSGIWTYIERIGDAAGISAETIGTALAAGAFAGLIGALTAAGIASKFGRAIPLTLTAVLQAVAIVLMRDHPQIAAFFLASALFQFFWNFGIPYQMGVMSRADPAGGYVVLVTAVTGIGFTVGPLLGAALMEQGGTNVFLYTEALLCAVSLALILPVALSLKRD
jgi:predicted MFS family arabinose efflux permease